VPSTVPVEFMVHPAKRARFEQIIAKRSPEGSFTFQKNRARHWRVEAVEDTDRVEEVYCAVVPETHTFTLANDLLTGNCGFYPSQPFLTELDRRQQTRVVRRAITEIVRAAATIAPKVTVTAVGGNHGENRQNNKRHTGFGDNDDVAVFEQVAEIFNASPHDNIAFYIPNERLAVALNIHNNIIAWTHGHLAKPQANAAQALWNWWKENTMGRYYPAVADANILVAGHFHHFNVKEQEGRTVFVCPSLTAVGDWFSNERGVQTVPGTLSFVVNESGWNSVELLR
jgi:predicted phosphodiesterase